MDYNNLPQMLVYYAKKHLELHDLDAVYVKNLIMDRLKLLEPEKQPLSAQQQQEIEAYSVPDPLFSRLKSAAAQLALCDEGMEESFAAFIMGLLTPAPSAVAAKFYALMEKSPQEACDYLYRISIKNNYIQKTAIDKNLYWKAQFADNFLEVTINLSKPEKDNKEIARMLAQPQVSYPKCMLCKENLGYSGSLAKPPRQNLRIVPITLSGEQWYMQYSPYLYYDRHCIAFSAEHKPMSVDGTTPKKLCDFVTLFPHFFVGSNASIPIVGGSILSHEHYQGGGHKMPVHYADEYKSFTSSKYEGAEFAIVNWYNSVVRIKAAGKEEIVRACADLIEFWQHYSNEQCGILSHTNGQGHNAVTPIMRRENGIFIADIILRNNRTNAQHPDGIFHAHKQYHHIKKEGIGLIEAMGMFILPGRLKAETSQIADILCGKSSGDGPEIHRAMTEELKQKAKGTLSRQDADALIREYINNVCKNILINTAVFKPNDTERAEFCRFMQEFLAE